MFAVSPSRPILLVLFAAVLVWAVALPAVAVDEAEETVTVTDDEVYDDDIYSDDDIYGDEDLPGGEETQTVTDDEVYEDDAADEEKTAGDKSPLEIDGVPVIDDAKALDKDIADEAIVGPGPELTAEEAAKDRRTGGSDVEDLYVTATKREESVQDVPISMAALSSSFLEDSGITNFGQVAEYVPNLTINPVTDTRGTVIRIRGIGSVGNNAGIDPSVGVFIDGVYQGRAGMSAGDLLDIERVEVLRGPQGTLYGKNTAAGLINIISKRPSYEWESTLEGVVGNYSNYETRATVNIPIVEDVMAMRLSGYYVTRDGFDKRLDVGGRTYAPWSEGAGAWDPVTNPDGNQYNFPGYYDYRFDEPFVFQNGRVNDANKWGVRGRWLWEVTDQLSLLLTGDYSREDTKCCVADVLTYEGYPSLNYLLVFAPIPGLLFPSAGLSGAVNELLPQRGGTGIPLAEEDGFDRVVGANTDPINSVEIGGASLDAAYDIENPGGWFDGSSLDLIAAWRTYTSDSQFDGDFSYYDAVAAWTETTLNQYSVELRLASPGGELVDYQTGLYYYHQTQDTVDRNGFQSDFVLLFGVAPPDTENIGTNTHETTSYAWFGQATVTPWEWMSVTGGARVTHEKKTRVGSQFSNLPACIPRFPGDVDPPGCPDAPPIIGPPSFADQERAVTNTSWTAIARFFPFEDVMLYGSFATGFKSGGFNQLRTKIGIPGEFDDEESMNVEAGFKTSFLERMVTLNATAFYTEYDQFQAQTFDGSSINVINAGSLTSYGVEADLVVVPLPGLVIGSSLGFNIAQYDQFLSGEATNTQKWNGTKNPALPSNAPGFPIYCSGDGTTDVPAWWTSANTAACTQDLSGKSLDSAPEWTVNLFAQYDYLLPWVPIEIFARAEYAYSSSRFLAVDLDPELLQTATHIVNLRAGFRAENKLWEITGWIRNLTDEGYNVVGFDIPTLNGYAGVNAPPRQYGVTVRLSFGEGSFDWF